jgi:ATP-dependent Zn protease
MIDKRQSWNLGYWLVALLLLAFVQSLWQGAQQFESVPYSAFEKALAEGRVAEVVVSDRTMTGRLKSPDGGKSVLITTRVEPDLAARLEKYNTGVSFADVAGVDEAKAELEEVVEFLRNPAEYGKLGAHIPKGMLLVGPPGTGKTLLARAVAGEAGVPFFSISGSEFVEMFVGVGAARVRDLFEQARKAPAIIFIDELDALGRARSSGQMRRPRRAEQTLNQLLTELDGFDPSVGIVISWPPPTAPRSSTPRCCAPAASTARCWWTGPTRRAVCRSWRAHEKGEAGPGRRPEKVAALTPGFSGADLANLVNEAALLATRRKAPPVTMEDFTAAVERIVAGLEKKNRVLNPQGARDRGLSRDGARAGGAGAAGGDPVHKVSIIPRGIGALGYTMQRPTEDRFLMTRRAGAQDRRAAGRARGREARVRRAVHRGGRRSGARPPTSPATWSPATACGCR